jgi:hypothetical protein
MEAAFFAVLQLEMEVKFQLRYSKGTKASAKADAVFIGNEAAQLETPAPGEGRTRGFLWISPLLVR